MEHCPKCGAPLKTDKEYCIRCGSMLTKEALSGEKPNFDVEYIKKEKIDFDSLLQLYVGKKYDLIESQNFSVWNLAFPILYSFYRRYYSMAIISMIAFSIAYAISLWITPTVVNALPFGLDKFTLTPYLIIFFFAFLTSYLLSKNYNKRYLTYAGSKVKKIMYSEKNKDAKTIKRKCIKRGNPNVLYCFIGWFITSIVVSLIIGIIVSTEILVLSVKQKNAYKTGNEICENIEKYRSSFDDKKGVVIDLKDIKELNQYEGRLEVKTFDNRINIYNVRKKDISCSGLCGGDVDCSVNIKNNTIRQIVTLLTEEKEVLYNQKDVDYELNPKSWTVYK